MRIINWNILSKLEQDKILQRPTQNAINNINDTVINIIKTVRRKKDLALYQFSKKFDNAELEFIEVSRAEFISAENNLSEKQRLLFSNTIKRISDYNKYSLSNNVVVDSNDGVICKKIIRPIQKVGLYVPSGSAPLISTLMMLAIPANIAECPIKVLCTPPNADGSINPLLLACAKMCGINSIYKVGGAQAIAAMAYGTESIPKVDKIYGPGNAWVTAAKQLVANDPEGASIDLPAGPSEVLVIADKQANPTFVAADLLAQAEHGPDSQAILITPDSAMAELVGKEVEKQIQTLDRQDIIHQSLENSSIIICKNINEAIEINNIYAPEHLIMQVENPQLWVDKITRAGAIFLGSWAPEALGDYVTGSNHVLPTYGYAKSYSTLSVTDFQNKISVQSVNKKGIQKIGPMAMDLADIEGLDAHKQAVAVRLNALNP